MFSDEKRSSLESTCDFNEAGSQARRQSPERYRRSNEHTTVTPFPLMSREVVSNCVAKEQNERRRRLTTQKKIARPRSIRRYMSSWATLTAGL